MIVSRETETLLARYVALIKQWNPHINLVSPTTLDDIWNRHISDCLQLLPLVPDANGKWVDLGSGGGLPGMVIAIATSGAALSVTLIESDQRKCSFLRTVIRELGLQNCEILNRRIELLEAQKAAYISARALARLPKLMPYIAQHMDANGTALIMKGASWRDEVDEAREHWTFHLEVVRSATNPEGAILKIGGISNE